MKLLVAVIALVASATTQAHSVANPIAGGRVATAHPTPAQVRAAIRRAERSPDLWATINVCNTKRYPHKVGVRGQMPALGFASTMSMEIQIQYYKRRTRKYVLGPGHPYHYPFGRQVTGLYQGGANFPLSAGLFRGQITFTWKLDGKVVGQTSRLSVGGRPHVTHGDPPGHSAATCRIP